MQNILSITELTSMLKNCIEQTFPFVWIKGEITNLSKPSSGHIFFTLKDQNAQIQCVWFSHKHTKSNISQNFDPLTGEVYDNINKDPKNNLANGLAIFCAGKISIYPSRGQYQLIVDIIQETGHGMLAQLFEQKKKELSLRGYFALERKRKIPYNPKHIALITSENGAAINDFIEIAKNRGCGSFIRLLPVSVQGENAVSEIVSAIKTVNKNPWADVIVIIRGGGSLEDLWSFNEEEVATAIFNSKIPVIAGIGHEVDISLADLTADLRAATPSHAAQLIFPSKQELAQKINQKMHNLHLITSNWLSQIEYLLNKIEYKRKNLLNDDKIKVMQANLNNLKTKLKNVWQNKINKLQFTLYNLPKNLNHSIKIILDKYSVKLDHLHHSLSNNSPKSLLDRGYILAYSKDNNIISSIFDVKENENIKLTLKDGDIDAKITNIIKNTRENANV